MASASLLTTQELADMRAMQLLALPDLCSIISISKVPDGAGGTGDVESGSPTPDVPCRLSMLSVTERDSAGRVAQNASFVLTLAHDQSISGTSRIRFSDSREFEVIGFAPGSWLTARRVYLRERI